MKPNYENSLSYSLSGCSNESSPMSDCNDQDIILPDPEEEEEDPGFPPVELNDDDYTVDEGPY